MSGNQRGTPWAGNSGHGQGRSKKDLRMKEYERRGKADQKRRADVQKQIDADWRWLALRGHACRKISGGLLHGSLRRFENVPIIAP